MGKRRTRASETNGIGGDDRPRGFQPDRMRELWRDIDDARDKLGLNVEGEGGEASGSITLVVQRAAMVFHGAVAWVGAWPNGFAATLHAWAGACASLAWPCSWLRRLPLDRIATGLTARARAHE